MEAGLRGAEDRSGGSPTGCRPKCFELVSEEQTRTGNIRDPWTEYLRGRPHLPALQLPVPPHGLTSGWCRSYTAHSQTHGAAGSAR